MNTVLASSEEVPVATNTVHSEEELSALDAARRLGIELNRVYVLLRLGRLGGRKVDGNGESVVGLLKNGSRDGNELSLSEDNVR